MQVNERSIPQEMGAVMLAARPSVRILRAVQLLTQKDHGFLGMDGIGSDTSEKMKRFGAMMSLALGNE